jgi:hypothetical protein
MLILNFFNSLVQRFRTEAAETRFRKAAVDYRMADYNRNDELRAELRGAHYLPTYLPISVELGSSWEGNSH